MLRSSRSNKAILPLYDDSCDDGKSKRMRAPNWVAALGCLACVFVVAFLVSPGLFLESSSATPAVQSLEQQKQAREEAFLEAERAKAAQAAMLTDHELSDMNEAQEMMNNFPPPPPHDEGRPPSDGATTDTGIKTGETMVGDVESKSSPTNNNNGEKSASSERTPGQTQQLRGDADVERRDAVKQAMLHAWGGYETYAFGHDEIRPTTNATNDSWGGFAVTLVDALDTLMVMGLNDEVERAKVFVQTLDFKKDYDSSFFETTIRYLGGLLSAHDLSGDRVYLEKATQLADLLLAAFDENGYPRSIVNLKTGKSWNHGYSGNSPILAEVGSCQLELAYLSYKTGNPKYNDMARKVFTMLAATHQDKPGLYPVYLRNKNGGRISFGSLGDSFYEYLLKLYLLTGQQDQQALQMYNAAIDGMNQHLIKKATHSFHNADGELETGEYTFLSEFDGHAQPVMEHLVCFMGGLLALGSLTASTLPADTVHKAEQALRARSEADLEVGAALTATCAEAYFQTTTGLAPEAWYFHDEGKHATPHTHRDGTEPHTHGQDMDGAVMTQQGLFHPQQNKYILRPEAVESLFYLWRITKDPKYREWGWEIFLALELQCKTKGAYTGLTDVNTQRAKGGVFGGEENWNNSMPSFFLAETLKYLFLLFEDSSNIPLEDFVFNTEAHPIRKFVMTAPSSATEL